MRDPRSGCIVCGEELVYTENLTSRDCYFCGKGAESNVGCPEGHYICDRCHRSSAVEVIEHFCNKTDWQDPVKIANHLMSNRKLTMHGPEHHFLVPAVLLAAYYNKAGKSNVKKKKIFSARQRAEQVPGGFCGSHGNCGAAVGSGIFMSLITNATPLAIKEWQLSNLATARSLQSIALSGGPRCCKRDSFIAISEAVKFLEEEMNEVIPVEEDFICQYSAHNRQCLGKDLCTFHPLSNA